MNEEDYPMLDIIGLRIVRAIINDGVFATQWNQVGDITYMQIFTDRSVRSIDGSVKHYRGKGIKFKFDTRDGEILDEKPGHPAGAWTDSQPAFLEMIDGDWKIIPKDRYGEAVKKMNSENPNNGLLGLHVLDHD